MARLEGMEILNSCASAADLREKITSFLETHDLAPDDIDLMISGRLGTEEEHPFLLKVEELFNPGSILAYKHLVGQYYTASAFAFWLAAQILKDQVVPVSLFIKGISAFQGDLPMDGETVGPIRRVLIFNQDKGRDFSWILLSHPNI